MRKTRFMAGWVSVVLVGGAIAQGAPCGLGPSDLMCEEFEYGDASGNVDNNAFWAVWPIDSSPTSCQWSSWNGILWINDPDDPNHVYYGLYSSIGKPEKDDTIGSGHNKRDLTALIDARTPGKAAVNGTFDDPLVVHFYMDLNTGGKQWEIVRYVELTMDDDEAATEHWEATCWNGATWPVFPDRFPFPGNTVRGAIAVGAVAYLDDDPCWPDDYKQPNAYQLAVFDGLAWYRLKGGLFGSAHDFDLEERWHQIKLTITETNIHVWMRAKERQCSLTLCPSCCDDQGKTIPDCDGCWVEYNANVPRQYTGPFNGVAIGNGGCLDAIWPSWIDGLGIGGGVDVGTIYGACCDDEGGCSETTQAECSVQGGRYLGWDTTCSPNNPCCPRVWADVDRDGDVDQTDFASFQVCFSGAGTTAPETCGCWDRDDNGAGDNDVDADDFGVMTSCWTGPNVPYDLDNLPAGCE